jgi:hypothetical protein
VIREEGVNEMGAKRRALCRCQVVVAVLFILTVIFSAIGCGTSSLGSYRASLRDTGGPRLDMHNLRIEHDLFNGRYQVQKEDWEDD